MAAMQAAGHLGLARTTDRPTAAADGGIGQHRASTLAAEECAASAAMTGRALATMRATAGWPSAELVSSCEPGMLTDGLPCCDKYPTHDVTRTGLVRPIPPGLDRHRVSGVLTAPATPQCHDVPSADRVSSTTVRSRPRRPRWPR